MDSQHTTTRDTRDARYDGMFLGEVIATGPTVDPDGIGQILVLVPGLLEPSSLPAFPIGRAFGIKEGIWAIPRVGSNVIVWLNQGDVDHPYYIAGPWGAPEGVSDVPEQAPGGSIDHMVFRWGGMHLTFDATQGTEKLTVQDLTSGSRIEIDKTTGDYLRDVTHADSGKGNEVVNVKTNRDVTVLEGDETHTVATGMRTTTIQGDDIETIAAGSKSSTVTLGNSTELVPVGTKTLTAGLNVAITAGVNMTLLAGSAFSATGGSVTVNSGAGPSTMLSGGLLTNTFLGGIAETVVGAVTSHITGVTDRTVVGAFLRTVSGLATYTFNGGLIMAGAALSLGAGPVYKPAVNSDIIAAVNAVITAYNGHVHSGVTTGGGSSGGTSLPVASTIAPGNTAPFDADDMVAVNVSVS